MMAIPRRLRFEILRRDAFTCRRDELARRIIEDN